MTIQDQLPEAREIAEQCWCDPTTAGIEMDAALVEVFARKLAAYIETAAFYARNADYWCDRAMRAEGVFTSIPVLGGDDA